MFRFRPFTSPSRQVMRRWMSNESAGRSTKEGKFFWRKASGMELFRITFYLCVPLLSAYIYANPAVMNELIMTFKLIQYPQSAPPPPVGEEIEQFRAKSVQKKD